MSYREIKPAHMNKAQEKAYRLSQSQEGPAFEVLEIDKLLDKETTLNNLYAERHHEGGEEGAPICGDGKVGQ